MMSPRRYWRRIHAFVSLGVKRQEAAEIQASASRQSIDIWIKKPRSGLLTGEMMHGQYTCGASR